MIKQWLFIIITSFFLVACNNVTQENFNKINTDMSETEVQAILGKPSTSDSVNIGGFSGTSSVWKNGNLEVTIQFVNGKVFFKALTTDTDKK